VLTVAGTVAAQGEAPEFVIIACIGAVVMWVVVKVFQVLFMRDDD
jgi:hypothetical protein